MKRKTRDLPALQSNAGGPENTIFEMTPLSLVVDAGQTLRLEWTELVNSPFFRYDADTRKVVSYDAHKNYNVIIGLEYMISFPLPDTEFETGRLILKADKLAPTESVHEEVTTLAYHGESFRYVRLGASFQNIVGSEYWIEVENTTSNQIILGLGTFIFERV